MSRRASTNDRSCSVTLPVFVITKVYVICSPALAPPSRSVSARAAFLTSEMDASFGVTMTAVDGVEVTGTSGVPGT